MNPVKETATDMDDCQATPLAAPPVREPRDQGGTPAVVLPATVLETVGREHATTLGVAAPFAIERIGLLMQADPARPEESEGVLNPAAARGPDGALYLFPRLVGPGNYSRVGIARVLFDGHDRPIDVTRLGYALEPRETYELHGDGGGCEDPRVTYLEPLGLYVMAYVAWGTNGPRLALAISHTLRSWERLGPVDFQPDPIYRVDFNHYDNKDGAFFPEAVPGPDGRPALALLHRPVYATAEDGPAGLYDPRPGIWISYCALDDVRRDLKALTRLSEHHLLMEPAAPWEALRIGAGTPPLRTTRGWLVLYHGVTGHIATVATDAQHVRYAAGVAVLDQADPRRVLYRSPTALLEPETDAETDGNALSVVFPTGVDDRGGGQIDVYYGMADVRIGVARLRLGQVDDGWPSDRMQRLLTPDAVTIGARRLTRSRPMAPPGQYPSDRDRHA